MIVCLIWCKFTPKTNQLQVFNLVVNVWAIASRIVHMHLSTIAYNLKKYLKFIEKRTKSSAGQLAFKVFAKSVVQDLFSAL